MSAECNLCGKTGHTEKTCIKNMIIEFRNYQLECDIMRRNINKEVTVEVYKKLDEYFGLENMLGHYKMFAKIIYV